MIETLAAYLVVAVAAAFTLWRLFLRGWIKRRAQAKSAGGCGRDCTCDGG